MFVCLFCFGCTTKGSNMFIVEVGSEQEQLGLEIWKGDRPDVGPAGIDVNKAGIYILDKVNFRINLYSYDGKYKKSVYLPKDHKYYDIAIYIDGNPAVLTDKGILVIDNNEKIIKISDIPDSIRLPYYFSIDKFGRIGLNGLSPKGRIVVGIIDPGGTFKILNGHRIFLSHSGYIGIQTSNETFEIRENEKLLNKVVIKPSMTPFGLTDNMEVYCDEVTKTGSKISVINKKGEIRYIELEYQSLLIYDDNSMIRFFCINHKGELVYLETKEDKFVINIK